MKKETETTKAHRRTQEAIWRYKVRRGEGVVIGRCCDCGHDVLRIGGTYLCKRTIQANPCIEVAVSALKNHGKPEITDAEMAALLRGQVVDLPGLVNEDGEVYDYACKLAWGSYLRSEVTLCKPADR